MDIASWWSDTQRERLCLIYSIPSICDCFPGVEWYAVNNMKEGLNIMVLSLIVIIDGQ